MPGHTSCRSAPTTRSATSTRRRLSTAWTVVRARHDDRDRPAASTPVHDGRELHVLLQRPARRVPSARSTTCRSAPARRRTGRRTCWPATTSCASAPRSTTPAPSTSDPASYTWTVRPLPDTAIINRPADPTDSTQRDLHLRLQPAGRHLRVRARRGGGRAELLAVHLAVTYTNLVFGEHEFAVRAKDADGNVDPTPAEWGWDVERRRAAGARSPPRPDVHDREPDARASSSPPRAATSSTSARSTAARSRSASRRRPTTACRSARTRSRCACSSPTRPAAEPQVTTYEWTVVESTPPETTIVFGPADPSYDDRPGGRRVAIATFAFESDDPPATFECALDGAAVHRAAPTRRLYTGLTAGQHILRVRAVDLALNVDPTPASWALDGRARHDAAGHDDQHR